MNSYYAKKPPRVALFGSENAVIGGTRVKNYNEKAYIRLLAIGIGANIDGEMDGNNKFAGPVRALQKVTAGSGGAELYRARVDSYLEVGFIYKTVSQDEYKRIADYQEESGHRVLFPLINESEYSMLDANLWYLVNGSGKAINKQGEEIKLQDGKLTEGLVDNYRRDSDGELVYSAYVGGGDFDTAELRVRVLYHNYYRYKTGSVPSFIFGTDTQGYDLVRRVAGGVRFSLLIAFGVSIINILIGCAIGAISGYFGGWVDIGVQRVSEILSGVPFIVVATLFQIHLSNRVGIVPSLLFAFVLTGWIGLAGRVRAQAYKAKGQEFILASRTLGGGSAHIILRHIFPNIIGNIITASALMIPGVIFSESILSYLGIVNLRSGELSSLGTLMSDAGNVWTGYPHLMLFPALFISLLMICFNIFASALRDAMNPNAE
jgi:oligopeptide transport system permease protein